MDNRKGLFNPRTKDETGKRYGMLTAVSLEPFTGRGVRWLCACDCGNAKVAFGGSLRSGATTSCGCDTGRKIAADHTTHGMTDTPEFRAWARMRRRCSKPSDSDYSYYGGRGIRVCERWENFAAFFADMGPRPSPKHTLDRINVDANYSPENCRWVTRFVQAANRRVASKWGTGVQRLNRKSGSLYRARIEVDGRYTYLGSYPTAEEAQEAFRMAAEKIHGKEALEAINGKP